MQIEVVEQEQLPVKTKKSRIGSETIKKLRRVHVRTRSDELMKFSSMLKRSSLPTSDLKTDDYCEGDKLHEEIWPSWKKSLMDCLGLNHDYPRSTIGREDPNDGNLNDCAGGSLGELSQSSPFLNRALPDLPAALRVEVLEEQEVTMDCTDNTGGSDVDSCKSSPRDQAHCSVPASRDFLVNITQVKDKGWYWGPISGRVAEKLLRNEPDGSFLVRDSSDEHYFFSLTFKLNGQVGHVRIEHDQGNFSFGTLTNFKSRTIVEFIEQAVEYSQSGRFLFFINRRPTIGPTRIQLLHPLSRFKRIQSLQHLCRFAILKCVIRKDLIDELPLPHALRIYLSAPQYYCEELEALTSQKGGSNSGM